MDLTVVEQFLNTLDERTFVWHGEQRVPGDDLTSPAALAAWLHAHDLAPAGRRLRAADLDAALALRAGLRAAVADGGDAALAAAALARFPMRLAPDASGGLRLTAAGDEDATSLHAIVATVATSVAGGGWRRLKLCAAPDCRWAFYDTSRNGGGRWCTMAACGNRHKTRAYRRRHAG